MMKELYIILDEKNCDVYTDGCIAHDKFQGHKRFEMECLDDNVRIKTKCTKDVTLRMWLGINEDQ